MKLKLDWSKEIMKKTAEELKIRISQLTAKGETQNQHLIAKAKRELRKREAEENK